MFILRFTSSQLYPWFFKKINTPLHTAKYYFTNRTVNEKVEGRLRNKDKVSDEYRIVYRAPYINYVKISYCVSVASLTIFPAIIYCGPFLSTLNEPLIYRGITMFHSPLELLAFSSGLLLFVYATVSVAFSYPLRIYCNEKIGHYITIYQALIPLKTVKDEFQAGELNKVEKSWSPWQDCLYKFKKRKAILIESNFQRPIDLHNMMTPLENNHKEKKKV